MIKHTTTNKEDGLEVNVTALLSGKFSVVMKDLDCGENLPFGKIFPADGYTDAVIYADGLVSSEGPMFSLEL